MNIITVTEKKRGCGYREPGGLYLRTEGMGRICGALPIELTVCPTCHQGIKPARGWTWINIASLVDQQKGCKYEQLDPGGCGDCPIADAKIQTAGLIWIGEKFYKTPGDFSREGNEMGISRRITMVPRGFKMGETWVALAHRKAFPSMTEFQEGSTFHPAMKPGIFHIFKPQRIEYVVKDSDSDEKLERMEKRGITLVRVVREQMEMKVLQETGSSPPPSGNR
jgi:hypothetical protein